MRLGVNTLFMVPGDVGGTETYLRETLKAAVTRYVDVEFILFTNNENDHLFKHLFSEKKNVYFECLNFNASYRPARIILEQTKLPVAARKRNIDVLWSPGYTAPFFAPCPQVVTICDLQYKTHPEDLSRIERITLDFLVKGACRRCEAVVTISEFSKQEVIDYQMAPPEKVHPVLLGVDPSFGESESKEKRNKELEDYLPFDTPYILCVAHTYPHKKVDALVWGFAEIMDSIPHNLVLVGRKRRGEPEVINACAAIPDKHRLIRFDQGLEYRVLQKLYRSADMFVLPSAYEGFGLPVLEAMMSGVPVITTGSASLKEVAGQSAFILDEISSTQIAENIAKVAALPDYRRTEIIEKARMWAQSFTWQKSASQLYEVIASTVN